MSGTYMQDVPLVKRLGLNLFGGKPEFVSIGMVEQGRGRQIKVEVCCMPAQFWRFTITRRSEKDDRETNSTETFVMTTGSGSLSTYWPIAEMIADNMIGVERA